jgi:serine/threonine-protein kinase
MADAGHIGRYELLKKLAMGGMAEIYLARQSGPVGFTKAVVLKRILPQLAAQQRFVNMFLDEARLAARFNHPNIVQIYDLGQEGQDYFIAMEYIHGEDLKGIVRRSAEVGQRIPMEHICKIFSGVLDGLHYAHSQQDLEGRPHGVVHRDVSPHNVLLSYQGGVKLVDFGIAKARSEITTTVPGKVKGKHAYMSPEQVRGLDLDGRSDIFSVGIVMYELLTWTRLFKRTKPLETLQAVTSDPVTPVRQLNPNVPPELEQIVMRALERERERRYPTARDMQLELEDLLLKLGLRSNPALMSMFLQDLFDEKVRARSKALTQANANNLESVVLAAAQGSTPDLVAFLDQFFPTPPPASGTSSSSPEFTPSNEEVSGSIDGLPVLPPVGKQVPPRRPPTSPAIPDPQAARGPAASVPPAPPPKAPGDMELLFSVPGPRPAQPRAPLPPDPPPPAGPAPVEPDDAYQLDPELQAARYQDELDPLGARRGKGLWIALGVLLVLGAAGLLWAFKDRLTPAETQKLGLVRVTSVPGGATVEFDGQPQADYTPLEIPRVTPGVEHHLKLSLRGLPDWEQKFTLEDPGKPLEIHAILSQREAARARVAGAPIVAGLEGEGLGRIKVDSQPPGALVYLDGVDTNRRTPTTLSGVPAGLEHVVMLEAPGKQPAAQRVKVEPGQESALALTLEDGEAADGATRLKVTFDSEPEGAKVWVNGFPLSKTTPVSVALLLGAPSEISVDKAGHRTWKANVRPIQDVDLTILVNLKKK